MRETSAILSATITGSSGSAIIAAFIDSDAGPFAVIDATIIGDLRAVLQPRTSARVDLAVEIAVGGAPIAQDALIGPVRVSQSLDSKMQTASLSLALASPAGYFGNPIDFHGPPFGDAGIDVYALYRAAGGERLVPMLRDGIVAGITRSGSPATGFLESYDIADAAGRVDRKTVTLILPPGHGLTRDMIVSRLAAQVGITKLRLERCAQMFTLFQAVGADFFSIAGELMETEGRVLLFDAEGFLVNPYVGDDTAAIVRWRFDEYDILSVDVQEQVPGDVLTQVTIMGTEQVLRDVEPESAARESKTTSSLIAAVYQPLQATSRQESSCDLTALSPASSPRLMTINETLTTSETARGKPTMDRTRVSAFENPEAARYTWNAGAARVCNAGVFLLPGATEGGSEPAYSQSVEKWALVSDQVTRHYYDAAGFLGPSVPPGDPEQPWGRHFLGGLFNRFKLGTISETFGFYVRRAALKQRIPGTAFEAIDPVTGRKALGNGEAVAEAQETFQRISREVQTIEATADGYVKAVTTYRIGWAPAPGSEWQYSSGDLGGSEFEEFRLREIEIVQYVPTSEISHTIVKTVLPLAGTSRPSPTYEVTTADGAPPAVDQLPNDAPDPTLYATPEEAALARSALLFEQIPIKAIVTAADLETVHPRRTAEQPSTYAQNVEECAAIARRAIERSAAIPLTWTVSYNADIRPGQWCHVTHRLIGWDHDVQIHSVEHSMDPSGEADAVTSITARKYPRLRMS